MEKHFGFALVDRRFFTKLMVWKKQLQLTNENVCRYGWEHNLKLNGVKMVYQKMPKNWFYLSIAVGH
jgi:hypothetical protein